MVSLSSFFRSFINLISRSSGLHSAYTRLINGGCMYSLFLIHGLVHVLLSHGIYQNMMVKDCRRVCNIISITLA